jgi:hypothetical protein
MSALLSWLMTPLSGAVDHSIQPWAYWHARSMVLGWGVLIPLGALLARYFKITPRQSWPQELDSKVWWHGHRALQWLGVLVMSLGVMLAWGRSQGMSTAANAHVWMGWVLVVLGWTQIVAGLARGSKGGPTSKQLRGDHYDMTPYRVWFERLHKSLGWLAVLGAIAVIVLGLVVADAPRWMLVVLGLWWLALTVAAWLWQRQGRCVDTYQAIWGPDAQHPGNTLQPIGWGIHRPTSR